MNRRLPIVLMSVAALVVLPAATATAGGHHHASGKPGYSSGHDKVKPRIKPDKGKPTASPVELCGGRYKDDIVPWDAYTCDNKATGYFLYKKLDATKDASWSNSGRQHRVDLHLVWAWPTADARARHGASPSLPRNAEIRPLKLDAEYAAAVCEAPEAYGLQVDLAGDQKAGRNLDAASLMPTVITPPDGGFKPHTLAYYGHYDVEDLIDRDVLCAPVPQPTENPTPTPTENPTPTPTENPTPTPTDTPTPAPTDTPTPTPTSDVLPAPVEPPTETPAPTPTETSDVLPAPADTPTPGASATPTPTPTERAEVLAAVDEDDTLAATGAQTAVGLLAAIAAIAGGSALLLTRRRQRTDS